MPHKGPMQLIKTITKMDEGSIHAEPTDHMNPDFPLRLDGMLYTSALVELGAQAAAAHASIHGVGGAHAGLVLAVSNVVLHTQEAPEAPLQVQAQRVAGMDQSARYTFQVSTRGEPLAEGELLLSMQERPE
ncbi:MAG: hypothetical protein AAF557_08190 [Pseudomonadota bacterium]